ncbi:hypothetical protein HOLleu_16648 [Holothuria leucospilota]|uniref:Core-binding (CB) domain-containing protein n=1 Tax=Holothuria leucospilota TaxID=206669 RepID=A0A9Q1H7Y8_HOLLE|nr:hypothetical protein HOLleu_16648 [Holothuria leucospilota]
MGEPSFPPLRQTSDRPVRQSREPQTTGVLFQVLSSPANVLRLPTVQPDSRRSLLAEPTLVSVNSQSSGRSSVQASNSRENSVLEERPDIPSRPPVSSLNSVEIVHRRLVEEGVSQKAADLAVLARRFSTSRTYDSRLAKFADCAGSNSVNPLDASLDEVCSFLIHLYDSGRQVSTIKNYRTRLCHSLRARFSCQTCQKKHVGSRRQTGLSREMSEVVLRQNETHQILRRLVCPSKGSLHCTIGRHDFQMDCQTDLRTHSTRGTG